MSEIERAPSGHAFDDFKSGQTVTVLDYANEEHHDQRAGCEATVTTKYNGVIHVRRYVNGFGYAENYVPARLRIVPDCAFCGEPGATSTHAEEGYGPVPCCADEDACRERVEHPFG